MVSEKQLIDYLVSHSLQSPDLQEQFNNAEPIRHLVIDNFLPNDILQELFIHFPSVEQMKTHYKGLNENKAEHSDFSHLDPSFTLLHQALTSEAFKKQLSYQTGIPDLSTIEDRLGYGLHQGANQSFLDIHIDYNLHPITKMYRKLNLILFLNEHWEKNWGGNLELWDKDVKHCIQSISPIFNRCVIFECSNVSYHGYDQINVPGGITRKSLYQYYFIPVTAPISFHDTIFKTRPNEGFSKKWKTLIKDKIKNTGKKVLVQLGWKRFLK